MWVSAEYLGVEAAQKGNGVEILPAAKAIGHPFAGLPAIVEIEHRGDGIDAQAVDGVTIEPEQPVRHQKVHDFRAPVIVDRKSPIEVPALLRVGVLVERGAVEMA